MEAQSCLQRRWITTAHFWHRGLFLQHLDFGLTLPTSFALSFPTWPRVACLGVPYLIEVVRVHDPVCVTLLREEALTVGGEVRVDRVAADDRVEVSRAPITLGA